MTKNWFIFSILIIISYPIYPQNKIEKLELLNKKFQSFDYQAVIINADSFLKDVNGLKNNEKIEIYRLKGVSHYSLLQMRLALNSFINILKLQPDYKMNPVQNSPKIVKYFNEIKKNFNNIIINTEKKENECNILLNHQRSEIKSSFGYSLLLPGLGHLQNGEKTKGWGLITATFFTLGSSIYFIVDTNNKEDDYLNEVEKSVIEVKYNRYNKSYKYRNFSLISFAALWLYTQIDLLFLSNNKTDQIAGYPTVLLTTKPQIRINIYF
jgi:hypothetical protein